MKPPSEQRPESWRDLEQSPERGLFNRPTRRKRRSLSVPRALGAVLTGTLLLASVLGYLVWQSSINEPLAMQVEIPAEGRPVANWSLAVHTDGVLNAEWVKAQLPILPPPEVRPRLNLSEMARLLEYGGQVEVARIRREHPATLVVELQERSPIARIRVAPQVHPGELLLIADDGTVYAGAGYPQATLHALPGAIDVPLRRAGSQFLPLPHAGAVASLLRGAQAGFPEFYRDLRWVSWKGLGQAETAEATHFIETHGRTLERVRFAPYGFSSQLQRLEAITRLADAEGRLPLLFVDVSFPESTVVRGWQLHAQY